MAAAKKGLYANIQAKRERIAHGSGEKMRKPGDEGAPARGAFAESAKTSAAAKKSRRSPAATKGAARKTAKKTTAKKTAAKAPVKRARKASADELRLTGDRLVVRSPDNGERKSSGGLLIPAASVDGVMGASNAGGSLLLILGSDNNGGSSTISGT